LFKGLQDKDFYFYDGAMGTMLQKRGLKPGERPDIMNITNPDVVEEVYRLYVQAGSDFICSNTFGSTAKGLKGSGYTVEEIVTASVKLAKRAAGETANVALDMGPIGELMEPYGELTFKSAYEMFKEEAICGERAGADLAAIATMTSLYELKAAALAVLENTKLPVFAAMTFGKSGKSLTGCTPEGFAVTAQRLGVTALGINCSLSPEDIYEIAQRVASVTDLPLIIKPNAGLPSGPEGSYSVSPEEFAKQMRPYADLGAKVIGGCCGTTPEFIKRLVNEFKDLKPKERKVKKGCFIASPGRVADIYKKLEAMPDISETSTEAISDNAVEKDGIVYVCIPSGTAPEDGAAAIVDIQMESPLPLYVTIYEDSAADAVLRAVDGIPAVTLPNGGAAAKDAAKKYGAQLL